MSTEEDAAVLRLAAEIIDHLGGRYSTGQCRYCSDQRVEHFDDSIGCQGRRCDSYQLYGEQPCRRFAFDWQYDNSDGPDRGSMRDRLRSTAEALDPHEYSPPAGEAGRPSEQWL